MAAPEVWVAKDDGTDIVRAGAIAAVGRDYNGNITVRLSGGEQAVVTLVDHTYGGTHTPEDFHLQLLRVVAELSDTAQPVVVRAVHEEQHGWRWTTGQL